MTLHAIVAALGGDLYANGLRANVPAPGHSRSDRSVSLVLSRGRVIVHGFGAADWRTVRSAFRDAGLIDGDGRPLGSGGGGGSLGTAPARPDRRLRLETATGLWAATVRLGSADPAALHLHRRAVRGAASAVDLGLHPAAPVSVYRTGGRARPALVARIADADDRLTAVELVYLELNGEPARDVRLVRKTVGLVPPGAAVRLRPADEEMLVGEGVVTTLSAIDRFQLAGWALLSAHNLAAWSPPARLRRLLIAADRGAVGEAAAARLQDRLRLHGIAARILTPEAPSGDWNEVAQIERREGGR